MLSFKRNYIKNYKKVLTLQNIGFVVKVLDAYYYIFIK